MTAFLELGFSFMNCGFIAIQLQTTFFKKISNDGKYLIFEQLFCFASYDEIVGIANKIDFREFFQQRAFQFVKHHDAEDWGNRRALRWQ